MARFFYNLRVESSFMKDEEGLEQPDLVAAIAEARRQARELLAQEFRENGVLDLRREIEVADPSGTVLHRLPLRDAVLIVGAR